MGKLTERFELRREELEGLVYDRDSETWKKEIQWAYDNNYDELRYEIEEIGIPIPFREMFHAYNRELEDREAELNCDPVELFNNCHLITILDSDGNIVISKYTFKGCDHERDVEAKELFLLCVINRVGYGACSYSDILIKIKGYFDHFLINEHEEYKINTIIDAPLRNLGLKEKKVKSEKS